MHECSLMNHIIKGYCWSSQRDLFSRLSRYGENEKSNPAEMTNDNLLIAILPMMTLLISLTTGLAHVPIVSSDN